MTYKWKPSKSAKREFANNMKDENFAADYYAKKEAKENNRRSKSMFDYKSAGGNYIPTNSQHEFCLNNYNLFTVIEQISANEVMYGYSNNEKINHDHIHIVNEKMRSIVTI